MTDRVPQIGDIVVYMHHDGQAYPAIVVKALAPKDPRSPIDLAYFSIAGVSAIRRVPFSPTRRPGHWSWRDETPAA